MTDPAGVPAAPRIDRVGDAALLLTLGDKVDLDLNQCVHRVVAELVSGAADVAGLGVPVPGYASVLVPFDPELAPEDAVRVAIEAALRRAIGGPGPDGRRVPGQDGGPRPGGSPPVEIPVRYGGPDGPDLAEVARRTGRSEADVIALHAGREYRVFLLGFVPGFPYLGILPDELVLPRRATPRVQVPAGSVAIAGRQTGIYPFATPGGWHLVGRTDAVLWDPFRTPPALLAPGARVRFVPA
jgi:KipI family sensor histidine kinase inhibitor